MVSSLSLLLLFSLPSFRITEKVNQFYGDVANGARSTKRYDVEFYSGSDI